ncbi:MAG: hypothetical protein ABIQ00_14310 [Chitinophagaceae bacterium]
MKSDYQSYVKAFITFAQRTLDNQTFFKTLSRYAMIINEKAHQLIQKAALNSRVDLPKLRKEIYQLGVLYIHKFTERIRYRDKHEMKE